MNDLFGQSALVLSMASATVVGGACDTMTTNDRAGATYHERVPEGVYTGTALLRVGDEVDDSCPATLTLTRVDDSNVVVSGGSECDIFTFTIDETTFHIDDDVATFPVKARFERDGVAYFNCTLADGCHGRFEMTVTDADEPYTVFRFMRMVTANDTEVDFKVSAGGPPPGPDGNP